MSDFWAVAKKTLSTVAPMLASAVGGPLAGAATNAIIGALGLAPDTTPEAVASVVSGATAEQLIALKKADQDFAVQMGKLNLDAEKLGFDDRANARQQTVSLAQSKSNLAWGAPLYSILVMASFVYAEYLAWHTGLDANPVQIGIIECLKAAVFAVGGYWVGSSAGSAAKSEMLYNSTPTSK